MAERVGFEPTVRFPVRSLSRRVLSTAQSPLRGRCNLNRSKGSAFRQSRLIHAAKAPLSCADFASENHVEKLPANAINAVAVLGIVRRAMRPL